MAKKFSSEFDSRGTVKTTDKLMIQNIDTGAVEYTTVAGLIAAISVLTNDIGIGITPTNALTIQGDDANPDNLAEVPGYSHFRLKGRSDQTNSLYMWSNGAATYNAIQSSDTTPTAKFLLLNPFGGNVIIGGTAPTSVLQVVGLPEYNDNANAAASGLTAGAFYRTGDDLKVVH